MTYPNFRKYPQEKYKLHWNIMTLTEVFPSMQCACTVIPSCNIAMEQSL